MKRAILLIVCLFLVVSCSSVKRSQKELNKGNYENALQIAIKKLQKNKTKAAYADYILILEEGYQKLNDSYLQQISILEKENNQANSRIIYSLYSRLYQFQNQIKPLLPLYNIKHSREAIFYMEDYSDKLIEAKEDYAAFLYQQSKSLMDRKIKLDYRKAYKSLQELQKLAPNYKDSEQLIREAHYFGTDFVFVEIKNSTPYMLPYRVEQDLLDFNTYGLDDFWTEYHSLNRRDIDYDFEVHLNFRDIRITPEQVVKQQIPLEREIIDGFTYQKDRQGNFVLDSLGKRIKVDRYILVKGILNETIQSKEIQVSGQVDYFDVNQKRVINSFPLETVFIFENAFATFKGDERVLGREEKKLLGNNFIPFPSNEQMLIDSSNEIKTRLSAILKKNTFR